MAGESLVTRSWRNYGGLSNDISVTGILCINGFIAISVNSWNIATYRDAIHMDANAISTRAWCSSGTLGMVLVIVVCRFWMASSGWVFCAGILPPITIYMYDNDIATRLWLSFGRLINGNNTSGLYCIVVNSWLGYLDWHLATNRNK